MKSGVKSIFAIVSLAAALGLCATTQQGSSGHFVLTNNLPPTDNTGTLLQFTGTVAYPKMSVLRTLQTNEPTYGGGATHPDVLAVQMGSTGCAFISTPSKSSNAISAFSVPGFTLVGNYTDPNLTGSSTGISLASAGGYLYAGYTGFGPTGLDAWAIGQDCSLTLANSYNPPYGPASIAISPDGRTLAVAYVDFYVDSYAVGPGGTLTERGPYELNSEAAFGLDITADSKYAIFGTEDFCPPLCGTEFTIYDVGSDGSLSEGYQFLVGTYQTDGSLVRLSPDERFIFADDGDNHLGTYRFTESPLNVTYQCVTTILPGGKEYPLAGEMATAGTSGSGTALYVAETDMRYEDSIGIFAIDPSTGCTKQVHGSPFQVGVTGEMGSLAVWPPRLF